jgi:hypothetical protein
MASKECAFETCTRTTLRGEKFCSEHNHVLALQAELLRVHSLVPTDLRALKSSIGPELEDFLSALARLVVCADPLKASAFGGGSVGARLPDKWTGQSMLDERGVNVVTLRGAVDSHFARAVLIPRFKDRLGELAKEILDSVTPDLRPRAKVVRPKCLNPECRWRGQYQRVDAELCGKCGKPLFGNVAQSQ